jgi:hypothetical protein
MGIVSLMSWCNTLERLDTQELKNLLLCGSEVFSQVAQVSPKLANWANTETAQEMTPEAILEEKS